MSDASEVTSLLDTMYNDRRPTGIKGINDTLTEHEESIPTVDYVTGAPFAPLSGRAFAILEKHVSVLKHTLDSLTFDKGKAQELKYYWQKDIPTSLAESILTLKKMSLQVKSDWQSPAATEYLKHYQKLINDLEEAAIASIGISVSISKVNSIIGKLRQYLESEIEKFMMYCTARVAEIFAAALIPGFNVINTVESIAELAIKTENFISRVQSIAGKIRNVLTIVGYHQQILDKMLATVTNL